MILMLSAETQSGGIWDYEKDIELSPDNLGISESLKKAIHDWVKSYEPYTALPNMKDEEIRKAVLKLDTDGVEILRQIANQYKNPEKFYYYSVGKDKLEYVLYKDGKEKQL